MSCCCCFGDGGPDDCFGNGTTVGSCCLVCENCPVPSATVTDSQSWFSRIFSSVGDLFSLTTGIGGAPGTSIANTNTNCLISDLKSFFGDLWYAFLIVSFIAVLFLVVYLIHEVKTA